MRNRERKIFIIAIFLSIILHITILVLLSYSKIFSLPTSQIQPPEKQPLTLVFKQPQPPQEKPPNDKFYELMENPNANKQKPENTNILSTQSSIAAAPDISKADQSPIPKADLLQKKQEATKPSTAPLKDLKGTSPIFAYKPARQFSKNLLSSGEIFEGDQKKNEEKKQGKQKIQQKDWNPEMVGDFALSTYEWNWAPYWLAFKRKLLRNWFTPPAYYRLGLIYGYTIVRFKVNRNGELSDFRVLQHVGHRSLKESSVSAIKSTFPFLPLPESFPDPYLEVTVKMLYPNLRAYRGSN